MGKKYDYLIIGAGLYGCTFACEAIKRGKKCLIIEKRSKIGGNVRTEKINGINVHMYGPHIFHTNDKEVWDYMNQFAEFNNFILSPIANYKGELFNLPFNMNTFCKIWGNKSPDEIERLISDSRTNIISPKNLEETAISMVGKSIYKLLIKEYTEKQWGRDCRDLPSFIIKRLPLRFTFNNNYFNDRYQGIPIGGYTDIIDKMVEGCDILAGIDYFDDREYYDSVAEKIVYTGPIDRFYDYCYGHLEYRSLRFEHEELLVPNYQGCAVMNFTSKNEDYTRIIEHKHFENLLESEIYSNPETVITKEYPMEWQEGCEPYYPINDEKNMYIYLKYKDRDDGSVIFGGRLAEYKYYDMDKIIRKVLDYWTK